MKQRYLKNVVTLELDKLRCTGCGVCTDVCPHAVFAISEKKAVIIDRDACMECGACSLNCPFDALKVQSGVGCAAAMIKASLTGGEPTCGCSTGGSSSCC